MDLSSLFLVGNKINSVSKQTENLFFLLDFSLEKNDILKITHAIGSYSYTLTTYNQANVQKCNAVIYDDAYNHLIEFLAAYELTPQF